MKCLDANQLLDLLRGRGPADEGAHAAAMAHAEECSDCGALLAAAVRHSLVSESPDEGSRGQRPPQAQPDRLEPGTQVGRFIVLGPLSGGSMGVVHVAYDPELDRKVAIKLTRSDRLVDGDEAERRRQRVLREARGLARLSHPNVVVVHEVGPFGDGVYIAMELVDGLTMTQWLRQEARPWREILRVFEAAGEGLAAAHRAGLVHRDLKPDNVLVGRDGRARIADFGLVRSTGERQRTREADPDPDGSLEVTPPGAVIGTPFYMAPEQHEGTEADPAADQFSFCAVLYEALYDVRPFVGDTYRELAAHVASGSLRAIPPGARVPRWLRQIVLRGLDPDPALRFPSIDALLAELRRHLRATTRRWVGLFGFASSLALGALVFSVLGSSPEPAPCQGAAAKFTGVWDGARKEAVRASFVATGRIHAEETYRRAAEIIDRYQAKWVAAYSEACEATHVRGEQSAALLDLRMGCLGRRLGELRGLTEVFARTDAKTVVDRAIRAVHDLPSVEECADTGALARSVPLPTTAGAETRLRQVTELMDRATAAGLAGVSSEGMKLATGAEKLARELAYPPVHAEALLLLGLQQSSSGDPRASERTLHEAARVAAQAHRDDLIAKAWSKMVFVIGYSQSRLDEALAWGHAAEVAVTRAGNPPLARAFLLRQLGVLHQERPDHDAAVRHYQDALALYEAQPDVDQLSVATLLNDIGTSFIETGAFAEAQRYLERAAARYEQASGRDHPDRAIPLSNLGQIFVVQGKYEDAEAIFTRVLAIRERALSPDHPLVGSVLGHLGRLEQERGNLDAAEDYQRRCLAIERSALGPKAKSVGITLDNLGDIARRQGKHADAQRHYREAVAIFEAAGLDHPELVLPLVGLGRSLQAQGRGEDARSLLERALEIAESHQIPVYVLADARFALAQALWGPPKDRKRAISLAEKAQEGLGAEPSPPQMRAAVDAWLSARQRAR